MSQPQSSIRIGHANSQFLSNVQYTDCSETKGPGKNTECLVCQEPIKEDAKTVTHWACGIAWHFQCYSPWSSFEEKTELHCPFCKEEITGSIPISPGDTVVCFCLHTLKEEVAPVDFDAKSLGQRETGQRFSTAEVADIVAAAGGDERVRDRAVRNLKSFHVKEWIELYFAEAEHARRCIVAYDFESGAERPKCCPTYHDAKHDLLRGGGTESGHPSNTSNAKKSSFKNKITNLFKG